MTQQIIICVDDEVTILRSLRTELKEAVGNDYLIEIAEGGEEALELIAELLEESYEIVLIISDYIMPDMKGDELLKRVHLILPKTLTIMLTGQADLTAVGQALKYADLYRYIAKPWQAEDLNFTVKEAVNSYLQDKELVEKNAKLQLLNQELEQLNRDQAALIAKLHENEAERIQFTNELFELNQAFSRFVPNQFLQLLDKKSVVDVQLGDQVHREMSVLFADICNFTTLSESMTPQDNFKFINAFLSRMEPSIIENQGFIDKYIGDAIMALFSGIADDALKGGISMLRRLADYNQYRVKSGYAPIKVGIGINTGALMLGTVGGKSRMDSTVISDAVNLASRLEGLAKYYGISLLISHHTLACLHNPMDYNIRFIEQVKVKGKSKPVSVFEVFDADLPEIKQGKLSTLTLFEEGLFLYSQNRFTKAAKQLEKVLNINPKDTVAQIYLKHISTTDKIENRPLDTKEYAQDYRASFHR